MRQLEIKVLNNNNNNNNNNNKLQLGYHPVAVVILHVHKYEKILDIKLILMFAIVKLIF